MSYRRYQGEGRLPQPVAREGDDWAPQTWEAARRAVIARLREVVGAHGAGAIAGIVSAQATNEEVFLFERLICDALQGRIAGVSWSPPDASRDDFLIDADKNPNTAGLRLLTADGADPDTVLAAAAAGSVRALVLLRADLAGSHGDAAITQLGEQVDFVVALDTHFTQTAEIADVLLPIATFAETDGTFVNRGGRTQRVREAIQAPAQARPGWMVLGQLRADLDQHPVPADASAVFSELAAAHQVFRHMSYATIGDQGLPVPAAPGAHPAATD
jgi:predicted molibdopterin-dependent oxidoreductase YjgC